MLKANPATCNIVLSIIMIAMILLWLSLNIASDDSEYTADSGEQAAKLRTAPIVKRPTPSASPIAGPEAMLKMRGECFRYGAVDKNGDSNNFEMCGYKSVRQTVAKTSQVSTLNDGVDAR